jgi:hypothetical protein
VTLAQDRAYRVGLRQWPAPKRAADEAKPLSHQVFFRASWRTECAKHSAGRGASVDGLHGTIHFYPEEDKISIF